MKRECTCVVCDTCLDNISEQTLARRITQDDIIQRCKKIIAQAQARLVQLEFETRKLDEAEILSYILTEIEKRKRQISNLFWWLASCATLDRAFRAFMVSDDSILGVTMRQIWQ